MHLGAARQCKGELACTARALDPGYWLWVISVDSDESGATLRGTLNTDEAIFEIELDSLSGDGLVSAMYEMLGIDALEPEEPAVASQKGKPTKEKPAKAAKPAKEQAPTVANAEKPAKAKPPKAEKPTKTPPKSQK